MSDLATQICILLVDDDSPLLDMVADYLRSLFHAVVITAASVPAAVAEIDDAKKRFDIVVTDYQLAPHTALDLIYHLQRHQLALPFIVHSSFTGIDESHLQKHDSYLGLVTKPGNRELAKLIGEKFPAAKKSSQPPA